MIAPVLRRPATDDAGASYSLGPTSGSRAISPDRSGRLPAAQPVAGRAAEMASNDLGTTVATVHMIEGNRGVIINVTSISRGRGVEPDGISEGGTRRFGAVPGSRACVEARPRTCTVSWPAEDTRCLRHRSVQQIARVHVRTHEHRPVTIEDVGNAAIFLVVRDAATGPHRQSRIH
jgi:hypothetical protein